MPPAPDPEVATAAVTFPCEAAASVAFPLYAAGYWANALPLTASADVTEEGVSVLATGIIQGNAPRFSVVFQDESGTYVDPAAVTFRILDPTPDSIVTVYTYLVDGGLIRDSLGHYHIDLPLAAGGTWRWRWVGTGTNTNAADQGQILVQAAVP